MSWTLFRNHIAPRAFMVILSLGSSFAFLGLAQAQTQAQALAQAQTQGVSEGADVSGSSVSPTADKTPSFPGGADSLAQYLKKNVIFPEAAKGKNIRGNVQLTFVVVEDGQIHSVSVEKGLDPDLDAAAIRMVESMPRWTPAMQGGLAIKMLVRLPVFFEHVQQEEKPLLSADVMPEFPGGNKAYGAFMNKTLWYPDDAREKLVEGRVIVSFIVEKDGSVTHPQVLKSLTPSCDAEALRVIRLMPKFTPGVQGGKIVRVQLTFPLRFAIH